MWAHYKKTFIPIQLLIIAIVLVFHFYLNVDPKQLLFFALTMEVFSFFGARWAVKARDKRVDHDRHLLPLRRRWD